MKRKKTSRWYAKHSKMSLELSEEAMQEVYGLDEKFNCGHISKVEYDRRFSSIHNRDQIRRQALSENSGKGGKPNGEPRAGELPKPLEYKSGAFRGHLDPSKITKLKGFVTVVPGGAPGTGRH